MREIGWNKRRREGVWVRKVEKKRVRWVWVREIGEKERGRERMLHIVQRKEEKNGKNITFQVLEKEKLLNVILCTVLINNTKVSRQINSFI